MCPVSNQLGRFSATAKTHKLTSLYDITAENFKLHQL